jgi:ATP-binding cassette, subfamily G (WHITE), eye pigment precursor transporter
MKQILSNLTGYARPRELMAVMGASGSGKTSLLNILGQRLDLSAGAVFEKDVRVNGTRVERGDFGKLGAFVMQDDILIETLTPFESFVFAAKLRTGLTGRQIERKAHEMVERLQLTNCRDTRIGGQVLKGISGGERKRTSIGYELITDPTLLLLDEPTSGLDASTAFRIINMLKREASQGMTIIATIHQPSGEIFALFDRLCVLQDGCQVYQGYVADLPNYFMSLNCKIGKYQNPADYIIKLAQVPELCNPDLDNDKLEQTYESEFRHVIADQIAKDTRKFDGLSTRIDSLGADRTASLLTQFTCCFVRNLQFLLRNPRSLRAVMFQAVFTGLLVLGLYANIGTSFTDFDQIYTDPTGATFGAYQQYLFNLAGLAFMLAGNNAFAPSNSVLLQIPLQEPVYKRERANSMYVPATYYFGRYISHTALQ